MLQVQRSMEPLTEFAPVWHIPFWMTIYPHTENIDIMKDWILSNEHRIIDQYASNSRNDGGTGLGLKSLTAQYNTFNLFKETNGIEAFDHFNNFLRVEYEKFMTECNFKIRQCTMYAWANVIRTGQTIKKHHHGGSHYAYLSGNMHFDKYETVTRYYNPYAELHYTCVNVKGGVTFFPSYIFHETTEHNEDSNRVSMAFDLYDVAHTDGHDKNTVIF
jgi:hypothetical protein